MDLLKRVYCKIAQYYYERKGCRFKPRGRVLMFHSVGDSVQDEFNVSVNEFKSVLSNLAHKNVIPLDRWETEDDFYALTFDDVPDSFYKYAYPLLKTYNLPFTIFLSTSLVGKEGYLSWEQILEISRSKLCTIGSHGHNHVFFRRMTSNEARNDLSLSKQILEEKINKEVTLFAFPYGSYYACGFKNKYIVNTIYKYGFGTIKSAITYKPLFKKYYLPRINVTTNNYNNI